MRLKLRIGNQICRANTCAVDDKVEFAADIFEFGQTNTAVDGAARNHEALREIIEVDGCVHQWNSEGEPAAECGRNL